MNSIQLPALNPLLAARIQPRLMKDTYKKVHVYLFDFDLILGKGSFSKVYKGINLNTNQQVAVKVIEMGSVNTPKLKQLLLQQIDILMKIKHENLIKCFQVLSSSKNTYIIMELCTYDFGSVCEFIQKQQALREQQNFMLGNNSKFFTSQDTAYTSPKHGKHSDKNSPHLTNQIQKQISDLLSNSINSISSTNSVEFNQSFEEKNGYNSLNKKSLLKEQKFYPYIKQIFQGLEYLHKENIVHRDLKLSNIFLTRNKACKIGDFGFATIIPSNQTSIKDTCCIGSPLYMSPQSYLDNVYSLKSDIWSFGVLIFEMIYGNPPLWNCPTHDVLKQEIKIPINMKKFQKLAIISQELKQVIQGCLQVDVYKRFSVSDLKETKLFKRLFYQPLESEVILNIKENKTIEESNVFVFERTLQRNDSIRPFDIEQFRLNNFSSIETGETLEKDREFLTKGISGNKSQAPRKAERCQTINPLQNLTTMYDEMSNNSMTDRFNNTDYKRQITSPFKNQTSSNAQSFGQKFRPIDMNSPSMRQRAKSPAFSYKNSQGMQKYLKEMSEKSKLKENCKVEPNNFENKTVTFSDLQKVLGSPKTKKQSSQISSSEKQSPRFASTSNNSFFYSPRFSKDQQEDLMSKNFSRTADNFRPQKKDDQNLMSKNYSMLEAKSKSPKQFSAFSPKHNESYKFYFNKEDKQNIKQDSLLAKNYSVGNFAPAAKSYSISKQPSEKYEYKTKILEKCTSSPKFEPMQNDSSLKDNKSIDKYPKYMTTSSFFGNVSAKISQDKSLNNIKQSNDKQAISKGYQGTSKLLSQFQKKMTEHPSLIQKRTYWKGNNHKNFTINLGQKEPEEKQTGNERNSLNSSRNNTFLYATSTNEDQKAPSVKKSIFSKQNEPQVTSMSQAFKLLNGQLIIKEACELIHYTRLLHKLSFTTESNNSSILLLQYSIQILSNLLEKCENFEIKYHYDSSTGKSIEIRDAFKANQCSLSNLALVNEKQCYSIKKDILTNNNQSSSSSCNKTVQLKNIILSYLKKYMQRKQALIKLFECNALLENLTNKGKDINKPISRTENRAYTIKRSSFSEKGYLNFTKLQKTLQEIDSEIVSRKENAKQLFAQMASKQQSISSRTLINVALVCIDAISKCVQEKSFINLIQVLRDNLKYVAKNDFELSRNLMKNDQNSEKSLIQRLLQGFNMDQKNTTKQNVDGQSQKDSLLLRNFSAFVTTKTNKLQL